MTLNPDHVILSFYENKIEEMDLSQQENLQRLFKMISIIEDPNYEENEEKDVDEFLRQAEEEEETKIKKKASEKTLLYKKELESKKEPLQGFINLEYLENSENER